MRRLISAPPFGIRLCSVWSLEVPGHTAGQYLQRAGDTADFGSALFAAANHFYASDMAEVMPHVGMQTAIYLPTAGGAFVCTVVGATSGKQSLLYVRAATWIDETMLREVVDDLPFAIIIRGNIDANVRSIALALRSRC